MGKFMTYLNYKLPNSISKKTQLEVARRYSLGESSPALGKEFGITGDSVIRFCIEQGIAIRNYKDAAPARLYLNETYFDIINTDAKAYWLGFLSADGNVYGNSISIFLAIKDLKHLKKFKRDLELEHKVSVSNKYGRCSIKFRSDHMVASLAKHGIFPKKSLIMTPSSLIPKKFLGSFWRGVLDGDGHISCVTEPYLKIVIGLCGSYNMVNGFRNFLIRNKIDVRVRISPIKNIYRMYTGRDGVAIYNLLFKHPTVYLERKYKTWKEISRA